jgi:AcrR family transcriptional regulator
VTARGTTRPAARGIAAAGAAAPGQREWQRAATRAEIVQRARDQLAEQGVPGLWLNGIARAMGMSGPAIYRYFDSRAALVTALATVGFEELAAAVTGAAKRRRPAGRLRAVAGAVGIDAGSLLDAELDQFPRRRLSRAIVP